MLEGITYVSLSNLVLLNEIHFRAVCLTCYRVLSRLQGDENMETHRRNHVEGLGFSCGRCGKLYENEQGLNAHISVHSNTRDTYFCGICETGRISTARTFYMLHCFIVVS